jgi:hypothetical protein
MQQTSQSILTSVDLSSFLDEAKSRRLWEDRPAEEYRASNNPGLLPTWRVDGRSGGARQDWIRTDCQPDAGFPEVSLRGCREGAHLTISLYDDPSGAEQSTRNAASWAAKNVAALIEGPPEVTTGWIRIHVESDRAPAATPTA